MASEITELAKQFEREVELSRKLVGVNFGRGQEMWNFPVVAKLHLQCESVRLSAEYFVQQLLGVDTHETVARWRTLQAERAFLRGDRVSLAGYLDSLLVLRKS